ncbi:hypothetical protein TNCV_3065621 [Trichonephila clavipes]|uniref:Uncharacterized protein n=1 Tax=Trichonephila clavipes TaxID=2585209 RepID=A0A8X6RNZ6_TRICX|nr:hypothetical protein TNCV_3065621 [Trichonephila clavipes]
MTAWIIPSEHHWYQCSRAGGSLAHGFTRQDQTLLRFRTCLACPHPRMPRAHQARSSRRSLAGVGLSESVRCREPGLALLTIGNVQQQEQH